MLKKVSSLKKRFTIMNFLVSTDVAQFLLLALLLIVSSVGIICLMGISSGVIL